MQLRSTIPLGHHNQVLKGDLCVPSCSGMVIPLVRKWVALAVGLTMGGNCDYCSAFVGGDGL